jgi:hypothetical protein
MVDTGMVDAIRAAIAASAGTTEQG